MLDFVFGIEFGLAVEAVADAEHGTGKVELRSCGIRGLDRV